MRNLDKKELKVITGGGITRVPYYREDGSLKGWVLYEDGVLKGYIEWAK